MALMFSATYHHYILGWLQPHFTQTLPHNDLSTDQSGDNITAGERKRAGGRKDKVT